MSCSFDCILFYGACSAPPLLRERGLGVRSRLVALARRTSPPVPLPSEGGGTQARVTAPPAHPLVWTRGAGGEIIARCAPRPDPHRRWRPCWLLRPCGGSARRSAPARRGGATRT